MPLFVVLLLTLLAFARGGRSPGYNIDLEYDGAALSLSLRDILDQRAALLQPTTPAQRQRAEALEMLRGRFPTTPGLVTILDPSEPPVLVAVSRAHDDDTEGGGGGGGGGGGAGGGVDFVAPSLDVSICVAHAEACLLQIIVDGLPEDPQGLVPRGGESGEGGEGGEGGESGEGGEGGEGEDDADGAGRAGRVPARPGLYRAPSDRLGRIRHMSVSDLSALD